MAATTDPPIPHRPRARLRQATYIDPGTGSRVKKSFSLRGLYVQDDGPGVEDGEVAPLLPQSLRQSRTIQRGIMTRVWKAGRASFGSAQAFTASETGKSIFKCSLAYLLGSMATFVPALSGLFGRQDSKHLVATITVYFHPARSLGSMFDALILALTAFIYTAFVSITSMSVSVLFGDTLHMMALGRAIVLVVFVGGGLGFVGWIKLKKGDPLVNVACSLTSLSLITVLTKEGAVQAGDYSFAKIAQILKMIVAGVIATFVVSVLIFPISARRRLQQNVVEVTDSLSDMLALITSGFLSGNERELEDEQFVSASDLHRSTFSKLGQNLKEAKYEHYFLGTERQYHIEAKLIHCVQRLTQSIGGLRSAATMQFALIAQPAPCSKSSQSRAFSSWSSVISTPSWPTPRNDRPESMSANRALLASIAEGPEDDTTNDDSQGSLRRSSVSRTPSQIFELFIAHLGPSMRSLAFTMKEILDDFSYDPDANHTITANAKFRVSLDRALQMYKQTHKEALQVLYDKKDMDNAKPVEVEADWEEAAASCGHFSFSLLEVADQVKDFLVILDQLQLEIEEVPAGRTWVWLKFWRSPKNRNRLTHIDPDLIDLVDQADHLNLRIDLPQRGARRHVAQSTEGSTGAVVKQKLFRSIHDNLSFFRRDDTKFAIKVGIGAALYALPAFVPASRPIYSHWRGEWGLLSYMLVCSMTIGASNTTGYSRFLGTCLGAVLALAAWYVADENPYILALLGFCMAYWTAFLIIGRGKGPMGRFIMLTYNLSALYAYSLSVADDENDGDEEGTGRQPLIEEIVMHRVVAVLSGCVWGLIITRLVWPLSAREKLKDGLTLLWLRMGLIWKRDPLAVFLDGESSNPYMNLREEMQLAGFLGKLEALVASARSEFELRGPFPHAVYSRVLKSTSRMLDAFHAMNVVILKDPDASPGEECLLKATSKERAQLCSRISHLFGVLASSMKLGYPIANDALPSTEHTRDRLLARIFAFRNEHQQWTEEDSADIDRDCRKGGQAESRKRQSITDEDFSLLYTYALVTGQLGVEINSVLKEVEELFGVLDEDVLRLQ